MTGLSPLMEAESLIDHGLHHHHVPGPIRARVLVMFSPIRAEHYLVLISAAQALSSPDSHELEVINEKPYAEL